METQLDRRHFVCGSAASLFVTSPLFASSSDEKSSTQPVAKPRHVICALGEWKSFQAIEPLVQKFGNGFAFDKEYSETEADDRMERAFQASVDRVRPSMKSSDWEGVENHTAVFYVLSPLIERERSLIVAKQALDMIETLFRAGATAIKTEAAGLAHGKARWLELIGQSRLQESKRSMPAVIEATVRRPISTRDTLYSCGAHLLGVRDVEVVGASRELEAVDAIDRLITLQLELGYTAALPKQLTMPTGALSVTPSSSTHYKKDSLRHTPFGYLRVVNR
ncbi:MAG: hypothetical protein ACRCWJ_22995 [Casimicrobium sp.]